MGTFFGEATVMSYNFCILPVFKCATSFKGEKLSIRKSILFPIKMDLFVRVTTPGK